MVTRRVSSYIFVGKSIAEVLLRRCGHLIPPRFYGVAKKEKHPAHTQQNLRLCPVADGVIQRHHQQEMLGLCRYSCHSEERLVAIQASQSVLQNRCCSLHMLHHIKKAGSGMNGHSRFTFLVISAGNSQIPMSLPLVDIDG